MFAEFPITIADPTVWLSIGQGLLVGAVCLLFGIWLTRFVGLLPVDAPAGETLGVGLGSGLLVLAAWWAAIVSGGRSSFTPVAIGFVIAIGLAVVQRRAAAGSAAGAADASASTHIGEDDGSPTVLPASRRSLILATLGGAAFVVAIALLYGSTMAPSPRDGAQPLEFSDEAFYSVLGADLARTGIETIYSPSGLTEIEGLPTQTWYHWGEKWLAASVITVFGTSPFDARHFVVLPLTLLAAATLTGTVVRRMTGATSRGAFAFGFLACLFLAPVPLAVGMIFEVRMYSLAAVAVLLSIYGLAVLGRKRPSWALACFAGTVAAQILPAHIVIAVLAAVGVGSVWALRIGQTLAFSRRLPDVALIWRQTFLVTGVAIIATIAWGSFTGHGVGGSGLSASVTPYNAFWRESVATILICSGAFLAIGIAWSYVRRERSIEADLYLGTGALLITGALVWGARLGDFNTFHLFYGGIAVFATPAAAVAVTSIWRRLRAAGRRRLAIALAVLCIAQLEFGAVFGIGRLGLFGPGAHEPVPEMILAKIRALPSDAKLAYACRPLEEASFWNSQLLGLDGHTGRRVVPMCFQADTAALMTGTPLSAEVPSPLFRWAPQRALYPNAGARPTTESVVAFLKANGIDYIYVDAVHPNTLVRDAIPIAVSGDTQVLQLP